MGHCAKPLAACSKMNNRTCQTVQNKAVVDGGVGARQHGRQVLAVNYAVGGEGDTSLSQNSRENVKRSDEAVVDGAGLHPRTPRDAGHSHAALPRGEFATVSAGREATGTRVNNPASGHGAGRVRRLQGAGAPTEFAPADEGRAVI